MEMVEVVHQIKTVLLGFSQPSFLFSLALSFNHPFSLFESLFLTSLIESLSLVSLIESLSLPLSLSLSHSPLSLSLSLLSLSISLRSH